MPNILLVDDERIVAEVLGQILVRLGHHVETAPGGEEGVLMFDRQPYDLVITDILMASLDGRGVAQHVRKSRRPSTPVIGISGTPSLLEDERFDTVIPKPFTIQALKHAIDQALGCAATPGRLKSCPAIPGDETAPAFA